MKELKDRVISDRVAINIVHVESGEGIEREVWMHHNSRDTPEWNPVKELKGYHFRCRQCAFWTWNPVKELKDFDAGFVTVTGDTYVESGEGIESVQLIAHT